MCIVLRRLSSGLQQQKGPRRSCAVRVQMRYRCVAACGNRGSELMMNGWPRGWDAELGRADTANGLLPLLEPLARYVALSNVSRVEPLERYTALS